MNDVEIGKRNLEAFSAGNWDEYKSYLADDAKYEELATRISVSGKAECVEAVKRWKTAFADTKARVLRAIDSGDTVVYELEWTGTHTGPLEGPLGTIQPTNRVGSVRAVIVMQFANGKIAESHHYFDTMTNLAQLGVLSSLGGPAAQTAPGEARVSAH